MVSEMELLSIWNDWLSKLKEAVGQHRGEDMCEASRMILSLLSILRAYAPESCTEEMYDESRNWFSEAISCIRRNLEEGHDPDGFGARYLGNIGQRLETLRELETAPCDSQA